MGGLTRVKRLAQHHLVEPDLLRAITQLGHAIGFTETLFVSSAGDNSDGLSWETAYTSLITALNWIENNQGTGEVHCIMLQAGNWDLDLTGVPTFATNIAIYGINSRDQAIISNGNATATGVLQFTGWCSINNLTIDCGTGETGINLNGVINGCRLKKLTIITEDYAGAGDAILLDGGNGYTKLTDINIIGEAVFTTGVRLNDATRVILDQINVYTALVGIHLDNAADDENMFVDIHLHTCTTGILIDAGAEDNHFDILFFHICTTRIDDNGTGTHFSNLLMTGAIATISPDDVAGVLVVSGVGANTWTVGAVQIRAASATPFRIIGIVYECAVAEKTGVRLYSDGGTDVIFQDLIETGAAIADRALTSSIDPIIVNQGLAIHARVKSEAGGNNTNLWLKIEVI